MIILKEKQSYVKDINLIKIDDFFLSQKIGLIYK